MTQIEFLLYLFPAVVMGIGVGLVWGEYRGYRDALRLLDGFTEVIDRRLKAGDLVLNALKTGEKVTVITQEGKSVTNLWLKEPKKLRAEDWDAIEQTTKQIRSKAETKANKRSS